MNGGEATLADEMDLSASILDEGRNCWKIARANRARVIVDAADYFDVIRQAMMNAKGRIFLIGWDFDTRIRLGRDRYRKGGPPTKLGDFILWLADRTPELEINILKWDVGALKMLGRGSSLVTAARWAMHDRITFKLDGAHPAGCSHHQKIVVIDDAFAVCGGIDMTTDRWDTSEHIDDDVRRKRPNGKIYTPWHDITMAVDGDLAEALGALGRERWERAGGETLQPYTPASDPWPHDLEPQFRDVDLAIARTRAEYEDCPQVSEVEALFIDQINSAKRFIYAESQYFASRKIAEAIAKRVAEPDGPEIVIVNPITADGWLEQVAMDSARTRLVRAIGQKDVRDRFRIYTPVTAGGEPIYVHAKLMIVDDQMLRVGSANMNNRSLGLDSECDTVLDCRLEQNMPACAAIGALRHQLLAEHLGVTSERLVQQLESSDSMIAAIEELRGSGRTLNPLDVPDLGDIEGFVADNEILDPEKPGGFFEPFSKRGLFRRKRALPRPA